MVQASCAYLIKLSMFENNLKAIMDLSSLNIHFGSELKYLNMGIHYVSDSNSLTLKQVV